MTTPASSPPLVFLSSAQIEAVGAIPDRLHDARFELAQADGTWTAVTPVAGRETTPEPTPEHRRASFFVDFDRDPLRAHCDPRAATPSEVVARVDALFPRKSLAFGLIPASLGVARGEGDCSEHATVACALLRCQGQPARVAVGVLVVRVEGGWFAGGHMWAERYDGAWQVVDATRPERHGPHVHLRTAVLTDEGPGARNALLGQLQRSTFNVRVSTPSAAVPSAS